MNLLQKIFSVKNNNKYKIITILGIKIKSKFLKNDIDNLKILFKFLNKRGLKLKESYKNIHCITHRAEFPNGGAGGGGAVLSCMRYVIGNTIPDIRYTFRTENKFSQDWECELADLWGAIQFVFDNIKDETVTAYITHDYGTAFGLYLLGKKYVYVSHLQGPRVEEKTNFGENFSFVTKKIINYCEKKAFENAYCVCFPSMGAYKYYCQSSYKPIAPNKFKLGPILYNTLYAYPEPEEIHGINKKNESLTFLSVGQLTIAKGMDRQTAFFEKLLKNTTKNIRYILVGSGPLKNNILNDLDSLKIQYNNFNYVYIEKCTYPQMQYLQDISDIYLMLHRISIFDLTTLEVMNKSKCVILSNVGGNSEFNKNDNIILVEDENYNKAVDEFCTKDIQELGKQNKKVYDEHFSNEKFIERYSNLINELLNN